MATTVGETGADFLNATLGFGLGGTSLAVGALLLAMLAVQLRARRYVPWTYWLTVVLVSVAGTLITDNLTDKLGVSLFVSTSVFSVVLTVIFMAWYASERTLSIHTITTSRRELFYWPRSCSPSPWAPRRAISWPNSCNLATGRRRTSSAR